MTKTVMVYGIKDMYIDELCELLTKEKEVEDNDVVPSEYLLDPVMSQLTLDTSSPPQ